MKARTRLKWPFSFRFLFPLSLIVILSVVPILITQSYILHVIILIFIYAYVVECWGIIGSYVGQLSVAHGVFFGIGAYTSTVLFLNYNLSPWIGLVAGGCVSAALSIIIGYPCFKTKIRHLFFVMSTLAINEVLRVTVKQVDFLGGASGLWIPVLGNSPLNFQFDSRIGYYYVALGMLIAGVLVVLLIIERTYLKLYLLSIREDEDAAESIGINVLKYKTIAFAISAFFTAFAGTFFAQYYFYIHPDTTIRLAFAEQIMLFGIVGGGGIVGPIVAACILVPLSELTRYFLPSSLAGLQLIGFGVILYLVVMYKPAGIGESIEKAFNRLVESVRKKE